MKITQALFPALACAAVADELPQDFDLNGSCIQTCEALMSLKVFQSPKDRNQATLTCHSGCMQLSQQPRYRSSSIAQQYSTGPAGELDKSSPSGAKEAYLTAQFAFRCTVNCDVDDIKCGFDCFKNTIDNPLPSAPLLVRDNPDDDPDDDSEDDDGEDDDGDADGDSDDSDDSDENSGGEECGGVEDQETAVKYADDVTSSVSSSQQAVLFPRKAYLIPQGCFAKCDPADLDKPKPDFGKCIDPCLLQAGFTGDMREVFHKCVRPVAEQFKPGVAYEKFMNECQDKVVKLQNSILSDHQPSRRAPSTTDSLEWGVSTTSWSSSGTMAMIVPTIRSTTTTTVIAEMTTTVITEVTATSIASFTWMPVSWQLSPMATIPLTSTPQQITITSTPEQPIATVTQPLVLTQSAAIAPLSSVGPSIHATNRSSSIPAPSRTSTVPCTTTRKPTTSVVWTSFHGFYAPVTTIIYDQNGTQQESATSDNIRSMASNICLVFITLAGVVLWF